MKRLCFWTVEEAQFACIKLFPHLGRAARKSVLVHQVKPERVDDPKYDVDPMRIRALLDDVSKFGSGIQAPQIVLMKFSFQTIGLYSARSSASSGQSVLERDLFVLLISL
jgi:hypothetical protein